MSMQTNVTHQEFFRCFQCSRHRKSIFINFLTNRWWWIVKFLLNKSEKMLPKISSIFMRTGMFAFCQLRVLNYLVCMHSSSNILSDNSTFFHKIFPNSKHKVFQLPRSPITLPFLYIKYSLLQCNSIRYTFILFCIYI